MLCTVYCIFPADLLSETVSIPTNPRTTRPVGYAFLDVSTSTEAQRAINDMNGQTILDRKVSVQLARNPADAPEGEDGVRRHNSAHGRGRGGRGRGGRSARGVSIYLVSYYHWLFLHFDRIARPMLKANTQTRPARPCL